MVNRRYNAMVAIAQSVERLVVVQEVAGSSPVSHPDMRGPVSKRNLQDWVSSLFAVILDFSGPTTQDGVLGSARSLEFSV